MVDRVAERAMEASARAFFAEVKSENMGCSMHVDVSLLSGKALQQSFSHLAHARLRLPRKIQSRGISCGYSCFEVRNLNYKAPGTQLNLLNDVNLSLTERSFGLVFGRSGSGKTTLLQLIAGLNKPTSGSIVIQSYGGDGIPNQSPQFLLPSAVGIVFQFPERYFLSTNVLEEVTFGWPKQRGNLQLKGNLASNLRQALNWVGLEEIPFDKNPLSLSGGYKRRLALAIQLVRDFDLDSEGIRK